MAAAAAERARAAAERARAAAERAPDEDVQPESLCSDAEALTDKAADARGAVPTGTSKVLSNKHNELISAEAWRHKAEDWERATEAWAIAAACKRGARDGHGIP